MLRKFMTCFLILFFPLPIFAFSQETDLMSAVDYKVNKMQKELKLTDSQAKAIKPVIKDYLAKRQGILSEASERGIVDHAALKSTLKGLRENEYQELTRFLSEDQMKILINKDNLMLTLNPDSIESPMDDGATITPEGANFKF